MAVNIHITIIELNALHTKRQNLFQELDAVIHLHMEAKHWGLRKIRNATSLNSRFKSLDTLYFKIISVTLRSALFPYTTLFRSALFGQLDNQLTVRDEVTYVARHDRVWRSEEHTSELQSHSDLVCRLLLVKKKSIGD